MCRLTLVPFGHPFLTQSHMNLPTIDFAFMARSPTLGVESERCHDLDSDPRLIWICLFVESPHPFSGIGSKEIIWHHTNIYTFFFWGGPLIFGMTMTLAD